MRGWYASYWNASLLLDPYTFIGLVFFLPLFMELYICAFVFATDIDNTSLKFKFMKEKLCVVSCVHKVKNPCRFTIDVLLFAY